MKTSIENLRSRLEEIISTNKFHIAIPKEIQYQMSTWEVNNKSPYSYSFYNTTDKTWEHTPEGCFRVSDHWNFYSRGIQHCITNEPVENGKWTLAQYKEGTWIVLLSLESNPEYAEKNEIQYKISALEYREEQRQIKEQRANYCSGDFKAELIKREYEKKRGSYRLISETTYTGIIVKMSDTMVTIRLENGTELKGKDYKIIN